MEEIYTTHSLAIIAILVAVLPLLSFLGILFFSKKGKGAGFAIANISISFILSVFLFIQIWNKHPIHEQVHWFAIGQFKLEAGILLNNLSVLMLPLISGVALLVHIYSLQYMKQDENLHRYWAYLGLFCASMMALVMADNLLLVYMCWELVGFSSYLLIGFWFTREAAAQAGKKAFIMNRIGDLGFLAGILILWSQFHTLDLQMLFGESGLVNASSIQNGLWKSSVSEMPEVWLTLAGAALFLGAIAKSAQFPLHTWLPDAMEGPTAVSSLIHAATMVAAGVFLLARVYPLFDSFMLDVIVIIGGFTAFMAATIALVQTDIKKILAFSTISQLGFMMLAMGVGAYGAALFHLVTHAFFKCLLFLAAGAVIHELHHLKEKQKLDFDPQDIRNMGGLRKRMPVTFATMLIAALALVGAPLTSGYLSKDAILIQSFEWSVSQSGILKIFPYLALITSWLTAFYIARLIFKVFFGYPRLEIRFKQEFSVHEAPSEMRVPLIVLAAFCLFPIFSLSPFSFERAWLVKGFITTGPQTLAELHLLIPALVTGIAIIVIYGAYIRYVKYEKEKEAGGWLMDFLTNQWYFNRIYNIVFVSPVVYFSKVAFIFDKTVVDGVVNLVGKLGILLSSISCVIDKYVVDGLVNAMGELAKYIGNFVRSFQSGRVQYYLTTMLLIVLSFFILRYFIQVI